MSSKSKEKPCDITCGLHIPQCGTTQNKASLITVRAFWDIPYFYMCATVHVTRCLKLKGMHFLWQKDILDLLLQKNSQSHLEPNKISKSFFLVETVCCVEQLIISFQTHTTTNSFVFFMSVEYSRNLSKIKSQEWIQNTGPFMKQYCWNGTNFSGSAAHWLVILTCRIIEQVWYV